MAATSITIDHDFRKAKLNAEADETREEISDRLDFILGHASTTKEDVDDVMAEVLRCVAESLGIMQANVKAGRDPITAAGTKPTERKRRVNEDDDEKEKPAKADPDKSTILDRFARKVSK